MSDVEKLSQIEELIKHVPQMDGPIGKIKEILGCDIIYPKIGYNVQQTIVIRKDLHMRKGKMAAQAAHASMKIFFDRMKHVNTLNYFPDSRPKDYIYNGCFTHDMALWKEGSFTKIVLGCPGLEDINSLAIKAENLKIPFAVIIDSGLTEFYGPTVTCIALGPYNADLLKVITKDYPLL